VAGILVPLGQHVGGGIAGKGEIALRGSCSLPPPIALVTSFDVIWRTGRRGARRPQPPRLAARPMRITVARPSCLPIADRPTGLHALYRARPSWRRCNALWAAGGRNSDSWHDRHDRHENNPTTLTSGTPADFTEAGEPFCAVRGVVFRGCKAEPNDPNAMALATVDQAGLRMCGWC